MSQDLIENNFVKYLEILSHDYLLELEDQKRLLPLRTIEKLKREHLEYIKKMKADLSVLGKCFGFSVCSGVMDITGKLVWWEAALVAIANWDGTRASLEKEIALAGKKAQLKNIIERVLNYVVFNHGKPIDEAFAPEGMTQLNFNEPDAQFFPVCKEHPEKKQSYLEFLNDSGEIVTVRHRKRAAGYFTKQNMETLLDKEMILDNICLLHSHRHVIRIACHGDEWMIYDPEYAHKSLATIHRTGTKETIIDEIYKSLGNSAKCLEIVSFKKDFSCPLTLATDFLPLLNEDGLCMLAIHDPYYLLEQLKHLNSFQDKGAVALANALAYSLIKKTPDLWNGLHLLARYTPAGLLEVCRLSDNSKELRSAIALALTDKTNFNFDGLEVIIAFAPEVLPDVLRIFLAEHSDKQSLNYVVETLLNRDNEGKKKWNSIPITRQKMVLTFMFNYLEKLNRKDLEEFEKDMLRHLPSNDFTHHTATGAFFSFNNLILERELLSKISAIFASSNHRQPPKAFGPNIYVRF